MRCLFVTWFGGGNVRPIMAAARAWQDAGGEAMILSNAALQAQAAAAGLGFTSFSSYAAHDPGRRDRDIVRAHEGESVAARNRIIADRLVFGPAPSIAADVAALSDAFLPQVMLIDYTLPGAMCAAEKLAIPYLVASDTVYPLPTAAPPRPSLYASLFARMIRPELAADARINRLRGSLGLSPWLHPEDYLRGAVETVVMSWPQLNGFPLPEKASFVGPQFAPCGAPKGRHDCRLVFCSLSTIITPEQDIFLNNLLRAELPAGIELLVAGGASTPDSAATGKVFRFVDFDAVLPRCRLMINHAGNGTVVRAVACGVPQISVPFIQDQFESARMLENLGVTATLSKTASPVEIGGAIAAGLNDESRLDRARDLAAAIARSYVAGELVRKLRSAARA
ncbi:glycosyltransferase [Sphingomonas sp. DG1-23]|uniref:glycosyltransferase n=1 Tax=Sphingomonas sp. DG1-23 TaxID=3068316 RepID=UPI00273FF080|nr:nucleotide disphospho-sugar-binding domain-containing protein [Sphingomonas sp. DG1-23]MDP5278691.1 glycosyltransferase [Sphingomonas sp. DG1-23]